MIKDYNALYGDELLVAAFSQLDPEAEFKITDTSDIVSALYRVRSLRDWDGLFTNYPFDTDGLEPRSTELTEAVDALQQSRLLRRENPDLVHYKISAAIKESYERFVKHKVGEKEPLIRELAEHLRSELNIQAQIV